VSDPADNDVGDDPLTGERAIIATTVARALQIRLLGRFSVSFDGQPVEGLGAARLQSLLAYLVLHSDAPLSRAHLASTFWPDATESSARNNLRQLLHQLRQALPEPDLFLCADASTVQWQPRAEWSLDAALFEEAVQEAGRGDADEARASLERALSHCGGPLLPSCYEDWIGPVRDRMLHRCKEAVLLLVSRLEDERRYASAIPHVRHWLEHDPLDEKAYQWLIRLHALAGDRAAAIQAFRQCAEMLRRELATEPSRETRAAYERIRSGAADGAPEKRRDGSDFASSLVGRQAEWVRLRNAWRDGASGPLHLALIAGEPGIGKSRLAEELLGWAQLQGLATARSRAYAAEGRLSLAPVCEWLRSPAFRPHAALVEDVWLVELARVVPEIAAERRDLPRPAPMTEFGDRLRLFEALARAVLKAPQPFLLLIDDLQWCDQETLEWLHFLSRYDPGARGLLLGTVRSEELVAEQPLPVLLRHFRQTSRLTEILLKPLDAADAAQLAAEIAHHALDLESASRLYRETEGNPLFVVEAVRAGVLGSSAPWAGTGVTSDLPPRIHATIAGRLGKLSPQARETAETAAVIGRAFDLDVLARVGGPEESQVRGLDELWTKGIVREQGPNSYDFTHDKLREVAYGAISAPQRRRLHRRVAEALEAAHASSLDSVSAAIAAHYEQAGSFEAAIPYYLRACGVAQAVYANDEALTLVERGLSLLRSLEGSPKQDAWELQFQLVLAPIYRVTKGFAAPELEQVLGRALALCVDVGNDTQRAQVLYGMQSLCVVQGRLQEVEHITEQTARLFRKTGGGEAPRSVFAMLAGARLQLGRFQDAVDLAEELVQTSDPHQLQSLQESQGLNYAVIARAFQSHALWCLGLPRSALERGLEAVALARDLDQPFNQTLAATYLALLQQLCGDPLAFRQQADVALDLATTFKAPYYRAWASVLVAYDAVSEHPDAQRVALLREAIEAFKKTGARLRLPYFLALLAESCLRVGEHDKGLGVVEEALTEAAARGEHFWDAELHRLRAELLLASSSDTVLGEAAFRGALEIARKQQAKALELRAAIGLARLLSRLGRPADAQELLAPLYGSFEQGLETPDLQAARIVLLELQSKDRSLLMPRLTAD
jgi:DNA-binding SARP family transcriptional activator